MKTEKDKLIDFLDDLIENYDSRLSSILVDARIIRNKLKSINPQNESDGHRRLEDNKDEKRLLNPHYCTCPIKCYYRDCIVSGEKCCFDIRI